jgi:hypothetical protein
MVRRFKLHPIYIPAAILAAWAVMYVQHPLGGDQGILLWVGDVLVQGGIPYRDTFEIRGPGFDYIHALIVAVFGRNAWGIRVFDLLMLALGGWLVWRVGLALLDRVAAAAGTLLFLLWYAAVDYWSTAQSDGWTATILTAAALLLIPAERRLTPWRMAASGALVALCVLNKPLYALFALLPAVRPLATREGGLGWILKMWLAGAAGFIGVILACIGWFAAHGALDDLIEVHILFTVAAYAGLELPWLTRFQGALNWLLASKFAVALAVALGGLLYLGRKRRGDAIVVATWLGLAVFCVIVQARFWEYQWLIVYPPLGVLAGAGVHAVLSLRRARALQSQQESSNPDFAPALRSLSTALLTVVFVAAVFPPALSVYRWTKIQMGLTSADQFERENYGPYGNGPNSFAAISKYIAARTSPDEGVFVWGTVQGINFLSGRRSPSRFSYTRALTHENPYREKYVREFFADMTATPPTYIVAIQEGYCDVPFLSGLNRRDHIAFPLSCLSKFPDFQRFVTEGYQLERAFGAFQVWRRKHDTLTHR